MSHTQEEGCESGDNLCIGKCADVSDLCFIFRNVAVLDHLVQLHACRDAGQESALVDRSKRVVIVVKAFGMRLCAGRMAELHFRYFLCRLDHVILMAEAVREYDAAALVCHIHGLFIALLSFRNIRLQDDLIFAHAKHLGRFLRSVDEVQVIG